MPRCTFLFSAALTTLAISGWNTANAASVKCNFISETAISREGEWLKTETDFMKLLQIFGDGLELPLEDSLLGNLDSGKPFLAGEVARGTVYLMGADTGVSGKLISLKDNVITIYDGFCSVGFG